MRDVILLFQPLKAPDLTIKFSTFEQNCVGFIWKWKQTFYKAAVSEIWTQCVLCDVGNKSDVLLRRNWWLKETKYDKKNCAVSSYGFQSVV